MGGWGIVGEKAPEAPCKVPSLRQGPFPWEQVLIEQGAATLAGLKTASLFCVPVEPGWEEKVRLWNDSFSQKGIFLLPLRCQENRALLYLCRVSQLQADLNRPGVLRFLARYGYDSTQAQEAVFRLRARFQESEEFPHEIGVFLGYPLGDVVGFIRHGGKRCKCAGCWKVYCNEREAQKKFAQIRKCREVYGRLWAQGRTVWQLTVAA